MSNLHVKTAVCVIKRTQPSWTSHATLDTAHGSPTRVSALKAHKTAEMQKQKQTQTYRDIYIYIHTLPRVHSTVAMVFKTEWFDSTAGT